MRLVLYFVALAGLSSWTCDLAAQPPANPTPPANDANVLQLLQLWERSTANLKSLAANFQCKVVRVNLNNITEESDGYARFMRLPDNKAGAILHLVNKSNPEKFQRYVCTGSHIYSYRPGEKAIYHYQLPPRQAEQPLDEGPTAFLFGMKANDANRRFRLKIEKQDEWYTYLGIEPIFPADKAHFLYAQLLIMNKPLQTQTESVPAGMPRRIYWVEPDKSEVTWTITKLARDEASGVDRSEFAMPKLPQGWQWKSGNQPAPPAPSPPNVIRPQQ